MYKWGSLAGFGGYFTDPFLYLAGSDGASSYHWFLVSSVRPDHHHHHHQHPMMLVHKWKKGLPMRGGATCADSFSLNGCSNVGFLPAVLQFIVDTFRKKTPKALIPQQPFFIPFHVQFISIKLNPLSLSETSKTVIPASCSRRLKLIYAGWKSVRKAHFTAHFTSWEIIVIWHSLASSSFPYSKFSRVDQPALPRNSSSFVTGDISETFIPTGFPVSSWGTEAGKPLKVNLGPSQPLHLTGGEMEVSESQS